MSFISTDDTIVHSKLGWKTVEKSVKNLNAFKIQ